MNRSSRNRLNSRHLEHFTGSHLFDKIARSVCRAECLPRKELYEAWEVARRVKRRFSGKRIIDLACGHGLLAHIMLLLDDTIPEAVAIDKSLPPSAATLSRTLCQEWPQLENRVKFIEADIVTAELQSSDLLLSVHGCGALSDQIIDLSIGANASVALLPCCHDMKQSDTGGLTGWMDGPLAIDTTRAARLRASGFLVTTQTIPADITPKNRLLIARAG